MAISSHLRLLTDKGPKPYSVCDLSDSDIGSDVIDDGEEDSADGPRLTYIIVQRFRNCDSFAQPTPLDETSAAPGRSLEGKVDKVLEAVPWTERSL